MFREIFSKIPKEMIEGKTVVDAGTGPASIEFLKSCNPKKVIAISNSGEEIKNSKSFSDGGIEIDFLNQNISDDDSSFPEELEVIFASYFFPALEGIAPFKTLPILRKFKNSLKKDGILIIVDFQWGNLENPQDFFCKKLWDIKDGLKTMLQVPYPRQIPFECMKDFLEQLDYEIIFTEFSSNKKSVYNAKKYQDRVENTRKYIDQFQNNKLREGLNEYIDGLALGIEDINKPTHIAFDYLIIAK